MNKTIVEVIIMKGTGKSVENQYSVDSSPVCYDEKVFVTKVNTKNGEVNSQTVFCYHQDGNVLWADYSGGEIIKGQLLGTVANNGQLDFYYQHINNQNQLRIGKCHSVPQFKEDGKIELWEKWQWLNGDNSQGTSIIIEK